MMKFSSLLPSLLISVMAVSAGAIAAQAQDAKETKDRKVTLSDGRLTMDAPDKWERTQPRVNFIEHEFVVPAEDAASAGRVTVMGAGGSIEENLDRWKRQFSQTQGQPKVEQKKIAGVDVHIIDLSGTFNEMRGPFAPANVLENYRMLGAIIDTGMMGRYFVKFTGPRDTVAAQEKAFHEMLQSLKIQAK